MRKYNIAPDGSCLFAAIDFLCTGVLNADAPQKLRSYCADVILANANMYSAVRLGKDPLEYSAWIQIWDSYGGENEITILADLFQVEICVASMESLTLLTYQPSKYLDSANKNRRIYLLYNGQHYNAIVPDSLESNFIFDCSPNHEASAIALATEEKTKRDLELRTRTRKRIQCSCGTIVDDATAFQLHAAEVEHDEDWAYDCKEVMIEEIVNSITDD